MSDERLGEMLNDAEILLDSIATEEGEDRTGAAEELESQARSIVRRCEVLEGRAR